MIPFVERHQQEISGVLSCFDRVVISGALPDICHVKAMAGYLGARGTRLFDDTRWAKSLRDDIRAHAERLAAEAGLSIEHSSTSSRCFAKRIGSRPCWPSAAMRPA